MLGCCPKGPGSRVHDVQVGIHVLQSHLTERFPSPPGCGLHHSKVLRRSSRSAHLLTCSLVQVYGSVDVFVMCFSLSELKG